MLGRLQLLLLVAIVVFSRGFSFASVCPLNELAGFPWKSLSTATERRSAFKSWAHHASRDELVKANGDFLKQIAPGGALKPEYASVLPQAELSFLLADAKNLQRATDPDRMVIDDDAVLPRTLDLQSTLEAESMAWAESSRQLPGPVFRSSRPGCDVVAGVGTGERNYSMKAIIETAPLKPEIYGRFVASLDRSLEALGKLGNQPKTWGSGELTHFIADFRLMNDPKKVNAALRILDRELTRINEKRPAGSQIELRPILPPAMLPRH